MAREMSTELLESKIEKGSYENINFRIKMLLGLFGLEIKIHLQCSEYGNKKYDVDKKVSKWLILALAQRIIEVLR